MIYILSLEPIESRYTGQWMKYLPDTIGKITGKPVMNILGDVISSEVTEGAFLNFLDTNLWKNNQINRLVNLIKSGIIKSGDKIVFPDAWHTGVIQVKYMSELMDIDLQIHSIWHAGSYDPQDFLGRKVKDKNWSYNFERSVFYASDFNYFATDYHIELFRNELMLYYSYATQKIVRSGLPFEYLWQELKPYKDLPKENIILFPHRIAPEKQPEIFKDLANSITEYEFIFCQDKKLSKHEYHTLLGKSKMIFSANLQETFGISAVEGCIVNSQPFVPDRLSYKEMYDEQFKYPSEWTENYELYKKNKEKIIETIRTRLTKNKQQLDWNLSQQAAYLLMKFCLPNKLYENLK